MSHRFYLKRALTDEFVFFCKIWKKNVLFVFLYHFSLLAGQIIVSQKNNLCNKVIKKQFIP